MRRRDTYRAEPPPGTDDPMTGPAFPASGPVSCEQIQSVLFDYMTHELGDARSRLVHEHLRHCTRCRREAADISNTLALLHAHDPAAQVPEHLSERSHRRLRRALLHPVLDWMIEHHWLVALMSAILALAAAIALLSLDDHRGDGTWIWTTIGRGSAPLGTDEGITR